LLTGFWRHLLVWGAAVALSVVAAVASIGAVTKQMAPRAALGMWPSGGGVTSVVVERATRAQARTIALASSSGVDPALPPLARAALTLEPTSASSMRILAYDHQARGEGAQARRLMMLATRITKRDRLANYWLIDHYARTGQLDRLLDVYDQTLRIMGDGRGPVLTMLASSLASESMIDPLYQLLRRQPPWTEDFWNVAAQIPTALENVARLRIRVARGGIAVPAAKDELLLTALADQRHFDLGRQVYTVVLGRTAGRTGGNASAQPIADGDFSRQPRFPPYDWSLTSSGDLGAGINDRSGLLEISALGGASGEVARQIVRLDPGRYRLDAVSELRSGADSGTAKLELACAESPQAPRRAVELRSGRTVGSFDLAAESCRNYWLIVSVAVPEASGGFEIAVDRLRLTRL